MKNSKYIIALAALLIASVATATVRTLNNNNPSPGQYTTYAVAEAASAMNDTIYVSGSPISYGSITLNKFGITIIGTGYNPQKQNPLVSEFGVISGAIGMARFDGIKCDRISLSPIIGPVTIYADNCFIGRITASSVGGSYDATLYLRNNILAAFGTGQSGVYEFISVTLNGGTLKGEITNNFCKGTFAVSDNGNSGQIDGCNITNNIFVSRNITPNYLFSVTSDYDNSNFSNNILINYELLFAGSALDYGNFVSQSNLRLYPDNLGHTPLAFGYQWLNPLFVNYPCPAWNCGFNYTYDFHLQSSSPGHNAGTDGTDIGPYGGPYGGTFTTYGEPHIPQMKQMNMPATVVSGNNFNVNVISTVK